MVADPKARTLYDDWQARRERLAGAAGGEADYRAVEMRLLDFCCGDTGLRRKPPGPPGFLCRRASLSTIGQSSSIITSAGASFRTSATWQEANARVRAIVERMRRPRRRTRQPSQAQGIAAFRRCRRKTIRWKCADELVQRQSPVVRIRAALELGESGDLDDIGLLSDLLSLADRFRRTPAGASGAAPRHAAAFGRNRRGVRHVRRAALDVASCGRSSRRRSTAINPSSFSPSRLPTDC